MANSVDRKTYNGDIVDGRGRSVQHIFTFTLDTNGDIGVAADEIGRISANVSHASLTITRTSGTGTVKLQGGGVSTVLADLSDVYGNAISNTTGTEVFLLPDVLPFLNLNVASVSSLVGCVATLALTEVLV